MAATATEATSYAELLRQIITLRDEWLRQAQRPEVSRETIVKSWAVALQLLAPLEFSEGARLWDQELLFRDRRQRNSTLYYEVADARTTDHRHTTRERLIEAVLGAESSHRVPLSFADRAEFAAFAADLRLELGTIGVHDATIVQIGSATSGWRGNPLKAVAPWSPRSDLDFACYSATGLWQALQAGVPPNKDLIRGGRYCVFKNAVRGTPFGFETTPLGAALRSVAQRWRKRFAARQDRQDQSQVGSDLLDFKLNLGLEPMSGCVVLRPDR